MRYVALVILMLCGVTTTANADDGKVTIFGWGNDSCGKWLASASGSDERYVYTSWILGWVSAAEYYGVDGKLRDTDADAMEAWVDNYCHKRPLESIESAAEALIIALAKHKQ
jgi:hypothetical protein